jgi:hypothetical protein
MSKKRENPRLEKMIQRNAERRKTGEVFRVETVFSSRDDRQTILAKFLGALPHGGASEFIRQAAWEKLIRDEQELSPDLNSEQIECLIAQNEKLIAMVVNLMSIVESMKQQFQAIQSQPQSNTVPITSVASSGLDMSRPRPKKARAVVSVAEPEEEALTDEEARRLGYIMAMSIKNACPGRASCPS